MPDKKSKRTLFWRFRVSFPFLVFGSILVLWLIEYSRPNKSELPVFEPAERVEFNPIDVPGGGVDEGAPLRNT